ncbi:alpha-L-glutamate ligase-like protein [Endozoicomonas sp. SM1973]|uniref:Alpha-L-glutamate ligase-like protein n=1 Tax=Spartinivicinus marinus TaxID=2994442 RepID=A0A853IBG8_9GAMM|nr:alpha-L-glutamate ligase-like protein [Spartinivicinus marinus]MCX4028534.1 alpha-L-glutamate ligase-like protein [Spartinivicinus marinus]NYZ67201.1 alpha-L-glutamate ligase-like protein [Spartinivicinus marinus]
MFFARPSKLRQKGILGMNKRNVSYIAKYNQRSLYPLVDNKLKTKLVAETAKVSTPKLLHTIEYQHEIKQLGDVVNKYDGFVIKPSQGSGGKGILVITERTAEGFFKPSGETLTLSDIKRHVSNILSGLHSLGGKTDVAMIEALVQFDPVFDRYSYEGVPDIRVIVFKGFPVMAMLRLSTHESDGKANLHQGAVGVGLNLANGKALCAVQSNRPVDEHPDTGSHFEALQVPHWDKILHLASSCYDMTRLGYLGADIVLDQQLGPLLLELNARPGLAIQVANNTGLEPRLKHIETMKKHGFSVDQRVQYSQQQFGIL